MIGVVIALEKEANPFLAGCKIIKEENHASKKVYVANAGKTRIVIIVSGIGKVNASFSTQILIDKFGCDKIINFGVSGGLINGMSIGDVYTVKKAIQYDFDVTAIDNVKVGYIQDYDRAFFEIDNAIEGNKFANLGTGDKFVSSVDEKQKLIGLGVQIVDMEGGAVAETCLANGVPCSIYKSLSDVSFGGNEKEYYEKFEIAINNLTTFLFTKIFK